MTWAAQLLPEDQLAAMLVECQPVRGIVANPYATWAELAAVLDAGTVSEGDTADKVTVSTFIEDEADSANIQRPRFVVNNEDEDGLSRTSSSGFSLTGRLNFCFELVIPPSLIEQRAQAKRDARHKQLAIQSALCSLPRQYPFLDLSQAAFQGGIVFQQEHNGVKFAVIQGSVTYMGATV
jgi:hypothetical protein